MCKRKTFLDRTTRQCANSNARLSQIQSIRSFNCALHFTAPQQIQFSLRTRNPRQLELLRLYIYKLNFMVRSRLRLSIGLLGFALSFALFFSAYRQHSFDFPTTPVPTLTALAQTLQIEISMPSAPFSAHTASGAIVHGTPARVSAIERYAPLLQEELRHYSPTILAKADIRRIVLCTNLRVDDQPRNGAPVFGDQTVFFEVVEGMHDLAYMRSSIHHELFHMIDWCDDGLLEEDKEWQKLNPPGFTYLPGGGAAMQNDPYAGQPLIGRQGFLNRYSMSGVEEDKAVIYESLMSAPLTLHQRCEADPILRKKVDRMKVLCREFSPEMNESFWTRAEQRDPSMSDQR